MNFSKRLKKLRLESGYTQKELATLIGISYQSFQKYENGISKPRLARLEELAIIFNVSVSYLLGETDTRATSTLNKTSSLSKRIKQLRLETGYTQKELAELIGVSQGSYAKYGTETGHIIPSVDRLLKLAKVFNVTVSYLIGETDERPPIQQDVPITFQDRLRLLRKSYGYTQGVLAKKLGLLSSQAYSNYERGVNKPSEENLKKIAEFFDVSIEYLLYGITDKKFIEHS
ncbi:transcriptional regulator Cro/CI family [Lactococcus lactis subsp. lactis]|uniref:helix-turn-helix domain-containing protein n=1 Tax=Lactococcus lactis TaxID=1358 RepID=UPI00071E0EAB|nr:helix-turn-helix transcriptional regulator [Lactococcus lactis]KST87996.1 transcriptional regulator Cro/CI family [Lactococcus lactis subsp. lactis]